MVLPVLKRGSTGAAVEQWQLFLIDERFTEVVADGDFGTKTEIATKNYQTAKGLPPDGIVGSYTYAKALEDGFDGILIDPDFPPKPNFSPLVSTLERQEIFGKFEFISAPTSNNPERIKILGDWLERNIVTIKLQELDGITPFGNPDSGQMQFHRLAKAQLEGLWAAWKAQHLIKLILTFDGSFVPRFQRGSRTKLSNHAFGSAFDINYQWNKLGHTPALIGKKGSIRKLVSTANDYGFFWGGHFNSRRDGMHFEVAKILTDADLQTLSTKYSIE